MGMNFVIKPKLQVGLLLFSLILVSTASVPLAFAQDISSDQIYSKPILETLFEFDDVTQKGSEEFKETIIYKNLISLNSTIQLSQVFKINTDIFDNKEVTIPTFSGLITFETTSLEKENESKFIWKGRDEITSSYATIVVRGDNVVGNIHLVDGLYSIKALGSGYHVLQEVNTDVFIDEPPNFTKIIKFHPTNWWDEYERVVTQVYYPIFMDKTIHLMVLYTENVDSLLADVDAEIDLALEETNDSHIMSDSDSRYKIVHRQEISYTSVGVSDDIDNMKDTLNADLGFIHDLRDDHGADVVLLITDDPTWCGIAGSIGGDDTEAFAVVDYDCMAGYFSFGHELGHIHGARHIISQDSDDEPFEYGHGYCDQDASLDWRTIMAYNCPTGTGGDRQQYWSNPDVTINGDAGGTVKLQDNARVHDETFEYVCSFREPSCRDQLVFLERVEIVYRNYDFCFGSQPSGGGLPLECVNNFDPCGCGPQGPLCENMLCPSFVELNELVVFTQLQEIRPYQLNKMGIESNMILPRDKMVILESDFRDTIIRVSAAGAEHLMKLNPEYWDYK